ncbi:MAG TPA: Na+/H+ antiporter NhaA, partial [Usitatibacteraceae bacterium]|nr:Na+/H+ antiporter NhaA [Usitatibacteraceae bacterium]
MELTRTFKRFMDSERAAGVVLLACTVVSLLLANSPAGEAYSAFWKQPLAGLSLELWINDLLMAIFFLLIGLELEREIYSGELSSLRNALLPICAAAGGMLAPALIHYAFNAGTVAQDGFGIPMATDIAFTLGVLALLGSRVPASLKVFVVAFAVIDDLGAIVLIATVYTANVSLAYLGGAIGLWIALVVLNRCNVMRLAPYLVGGALLWFLMLKSGVHATIAGVALAFAIPFSARDNDLGSPSHRLENLLHKPVAFLILPLFALANTAVVIGPGWVEALAGANSLGIIFGLVVGKPLGIVLFCWIAVKIGLCRLPDDVNWLHLTGAGMLGGIGFTMSIFITNLAF